MIVEINDKRIKITNVVHNVVRVFTEKHPDDYVIGVESIDEYNLHIITYYPLSRYELVNVKVGE